MSEKLHGKNVAETWRKSKKTANINNLTIHEFTYFKETLAQKFTNHCSRSFVAPESYSWNLYNSLRFNL